MPKFPWRDFIIIIVIALIGRGLLLASNTVSFHSDEAVVALMARHILQGARPTFFYGQAYMGSLDAWLVAVGFQLGGQSVLTVRLVQSVLYLLVVVTAYLAAWQLSQRRLIAAVVGLLYAIPAVNMALYTTATLGGYNETLLFGNVLLMLGYAVSHEHARSLWRWGLLGLVAGLAWWTNGLIVMYAIPVGLLILVVWVRERVVIGPALTGLGVALVFFFVGGAPWWIFDFTHDHAALATYLTNRQSGEFEGIGLPYVPPSQRALGMFLIGIPTVVGLRFPWSPQYFLLPIGVSILLIYCVAAVRLARGPQLLLPDVRLLIWLMLANFAAVFVGSTFGADPTGRYFLPLMLPLGLLLGTQVMSVWHANGDQQTLRRGLAVGVVALVIGYQALGQLAAGRSETGFTTQFDRVSHVANDVDAEVIDFLIENDLQHGHTNYWVAYRLGFLSQEQLQYSASLPYKENLSYNPADNRYLPFRDATDAATRIAYITTNLPQLDNVLAATFAEQDLTYQYTEIGDFHIYYDFAPTLPEHPRFD